MPNRRIIVFVCVPLLQQIAAGVQHLLVSNYFNPPARDDARLTMTSPDGAVLAVAISPDGRSIASGAWNRAVTIWDAQSGRALRTMRGHTDRVITVAFSPDGRWVVSGARDATARVWESET